MASLIEIDDLKNIHRTAILSGGIDEMSLIDTVRDEATLYYIVERANYIDAAYERSAWIMWSVANYHPFMEGNKRTALLSGEIQLSDEFIDVNDTSMNTYIRNLAAGNVTEDYLCAWIKTHAKRLDCDKSCEHLDMLIKIHKEALRLLSI